VPEVTPLIRARVSTAAGLYVAQPRRVLDRRTSRRFRFANNSGCKSAFREWGAARLDVSKLTGVF
jgi:hypothetical protein